MIICLLSTASNWEDQLRQHWRGEVTVFGGSGGICLRHATVQSMSQMTVSQIPSNVKPEPKPTSYVKGTPFEFMFLMGMLEGILRSSSILMEDQDNNDKAAAMALGESTWMNTEMRQSDCQNRRHRNGMRYINTVRLHCTNPLTLLTLFRITTTVLPHNLAPTACKVVAASQAPVVATKHISTRIIPRIGVPPMFSN